MKILRVFPRRTKATPDDDLAVVGFPTLFRPEVDEVHISTVFTWDLPLSDRLARAWGNYYLVKVGGTAWKEPELEFEPGMYLKKGYVITSRGCPNRCWFCDVWKTYGGKLLELQVKDGWIVQDDNLLACSPDHTKEVFAMLKRQPQRAVFSGGLEAARLRDWHIDALLDLNPKQMFFAYDTPNDYEPLRIAGQKLQDAGFTLKTRKVYAYVLIGHPQDTFEQAEKRLQNTFDAGFIPFAMLYRDQEGKKNPEWGRFQRKWARPAIIFATLAGDSREKE